MSSTPPATDKGAAIRHAMRTATGATLCLVVGEWLGLKHTNLAVWTTYMVMAQHPYTSFQKGVERIVGRVLGVLAGLVAATWLVETPLLSQAFLSLFLVFCFYLYFAGRLAYTFLNAGLYAVVLFEFGKSNPRMAPAEGLALCLAIIVGVAAADIVNWLVGAEASMQIEFGAQPLWPIRRDWLNQCAMLAVTVLVASHIADLLELPLLDTAISVMFLIVTPDIQSLIQKGELRVAGAIMATLYALFVFLVMALEPHFILLAVLVFLGLMLASYVTHEAGSYSYAGLQMGLVLPMLIVSPPSDFGSLTTAFQRLEGIAIALTLSVVIGTLWPKFPVRPSVQAST